MPWFDKWLLQETASVNDAIAKFGGCGMPAIVFRFKYEFFRAAAGEGLSQEEAEQRLREVFAVPTETKKKNS